MQWRFLARNRIIAGLAPATLVVEAPVKSGACSTARHALEQGRDVLVAAGDDGPFGEGCVRFAEEGAPAMADGRDLIAELGLRPSPGIDTSAHFVNTLARELGL
jgi:DNA processing protein